MPHRGDRSRPRGQLRGGDQRGRDIVRSVSTRNPDRVPSAVPRESFSPPERYSFPAPQPTGWPIQWRAARPTGTLGPSPQTHFDVSRLQVAVTEPSAYDWEGARSPGGRERSVRRANLTLPDADHRAPEIRHQASAEAPAARKAAELQATLTEIRAELGRMAAHVTENPRSTAIAATVPAARPRCSQPNRCPSLPSLRHRPRSHRDGPGSSAPCAWQCSPWRSLSSLALLPRPRNWRCTDTVTSSSGRQAQVRHSKGLRSRRRLSRRRLIIAVTQGPATTARRARHYQDQKRREP